MGNFFTELFGIGISNIFSIGLFYLIIGLFIKNKKTKRTIITIFTIILIIAEFGIAEYNKIAVTINSILLIVGGIMIFSDSGSGNGGDGNEK